jgi:hypothetical protein
LGQCDTSTTVSFQAAQLLHSGGALPGRGVLSLGSRECSVQSQPGIYFDYGRWSTSNFVTKLFYPSVDWTPSGEAGGSGHTAEVRATAVTGIWPHAARGDPRCFSSLTNENDNSPDGTGRGYIWNIANRAHPHLVTTIGGFATPAYAAAVSSDVSLLALGSSDCTVHLGTSISLRAKRMRCSSVRRVRADAFGDRAGHPGLAGRAPGAVRHRRRVGRAWPRPTTPAGSSSS